MKAQFFGLFILSYSFIFIVSSPLSGQTMPFTKGNLAQVKSKSQTEGKLHFAYFYTDWCLPCKWMEDNTFKDAELIQFVQQNYLAVKLNIDDKDGQQMREQFDVEFLPTLIIFNQSGDIVEKFEESLTPSRMLEALKKQRLNMAGASVKLPPLKKSTVPVTEKQSETPKVEKTVPISREESKTPPIQPIIEAKKETNAPANPSEQTAVPPAPKEPSAPVVSAPSTTEKTKVPQNIETITTSKPDQTAPAETGSPSSSAPTSENIFYAVQVGTYTRFENADARRKELKLIYGEGVHIKIDNSGKETIYRVMVGRYKEPNDAREVVEHLKNQNIDGFVKEITID
jgi:thiol-disulfide isomerase/thioredoxin/cell division protein FtsN